MLFLIPLNLVLSDTGRQAQHPSVLLCPWKSVISPLAAFLSGFVARKSWNNSLQKSGQSLIPQRGAGSSRQYGQSRQTARAEQAACQAALTCCWQMVAPAFQLMGCFQIQVTSCERKLPTAALRCSNRMKPVSKGTLISSLLFTASERRGSMG